VNCGHVPPLLLRAAGAMESLDPTATMVGAFARFHVTEDKTPLAGDDVLVLYSDGVTEAGTDRGDEFGDERLAVELRRLRQQPAGEIVAGLMDAVAAFSPGSRSDDVTVVAIRGRG
jgi:phosphoserine phosphatase RsbU/P